MPFIVGLWLPLSYLAMLIQSEATALAFSASYSVINWFLMGLAVTRSFTGLSHSYALKDQTGTVRYPA